MVGAPIHLRTNARIDFRLIGNWGNFLGDGMFSHYLEREWILQRMKMICSWITDVNYP